MARPIVSTDHILDNAADLVARHGFDRVTTAEIAKAAGVAKGVLYLRFTSKDELLNALLDREFANAVRAVTELIDEDHCGGLLSRLYVHSLRAVSRQPRTDRLLRRRARRVTRRNSAGPAPFWQSVSGSRAGWSCFPQRTAPCGNDPR